MLQNVIAGLQGIIDHAMVGHFVGYTGNAAIGVSWQIILVVIVFVSSVFTGMAVLVARFAGANEPDKVNRVVYQAFLTAAGLAVVLGALGWVAAPALLDLVNAAPGGAGRGAAVPAHDVRRHHRHDDVLHAERRLPRRRRSRTRRCGSASAMTVLTIVFNVVLIPMFGTVGAAFGTIASSTLGLGLRHLAADAARLGDSLRARTWIGGPTSRSSARCSASACRPACRGSR